MIISIGAELAFDKIQHSFMIKAIKIILEVIFSSSERTATKTYN